MADLDLIFKAYDVRGTFPDQIDPQVAAAIGKAFARFTGAKRILVARDMRDSGLALSRAFEAGALEAGAAVTDLGLASTDLMYFAAGELDSPGAMFTASHNPAAYNGIKMCLAGARPVGEDTGLREIKELARSEMGRVALEPQGPVEPLDLLDRYADHVRSFTDLSLLKPLKVVADTANGMGGLVAPKVFSTLPFDVEFMYPELDGTFPNHPADPIQPENTADLRARVVSVGADVGLAFDGDADRVFLVDEKGQGLSGSLTTAMVASAFLDRFPGATIVHNLICSKAVPEVVREKGGVPVRTRVGHSFIKAVMAESGAVFGGEHSGHYYFRDNYRADSGLIATMVVLGMMSSAEVPLSEMRRPFERYVASGEINTEVADPKAVLSDVESVYAARGADIDHLDGLTVDSGDWWFNLRPSNTEPLLRLNLEAPDQDRCRRRTDEVLSLFGRAGG
jgi:phosphomannomutase